MDTNRPAEQEIAPENPVLNEDAAQSTEIEANSFRIAGRMVFASIVIGTLAIGVAGWAATAELSGAVIAPGSVVVERNTKKVQHSDGGIVAKINVKDGDSVKAGEVLVVLDDTQIKAELSVVRGQLIELTARKARLTAEVAGDDKIVYPADFVTSSKHAKEVADGERRLFRETRTNILSQQEQLSLRIEQLEHEIKGIDSQQIAKHGQLVLIRKELEKITSLYNKKLTSVTRLYALEREEKRLSGEYAGLSAQIARTKGKISETRVQMLAAEQTAKLDAQRELRSTDAKLNELREREIASADRLRRTVLYAPQSGIVHELSVHTIGGVITSAETVMTIVPAGERLTIEARFAPVDIDQITIGRKARLRFSAFNQRTTPEVTGRIVHISADVSSDPKTSQQYYVGRVKMDAEAHEALKDLELIPGMPVEVFVSTGSRTALSYLSKPVTDQFNRAFRED